MRLKSSYEHLPYYPHGQGFQVPGELVKAGRNVASIRIHGHAQGNYLHDEGDALRSPAPCPEKSNEWRYQVEVQLSRSDGRITPAPPKAPMPRVASDAGLPLQRDDPPATPFAMRAARSGIRATERAEFARISRNPQHVDPGLANGSGMKARFRFTSCNSPMSAVRRNRRRKAIGPKSASAETASIAASAAHGPGRHDRHRRGKRYSPAQQTRRWKPFLPETHLRKPMAATFNSRPAIGIDGNHRPNRPPPILPSCRRLGGQRWPVASILDRGKRQEIRLGRCEDRGKQCAGVEHQSQPTRRRTVLGLKSRRRESLQPVWPSRLAVPHR